MLVTTYYFRLGLVANLSLISCVDAAGWTLDDSCSGERATKVRDSMNIAFQMARYANEELRKSPVNADVLKVYQYLFKDTNEVRNDMVKKVFESISGMSQEVEKSPNDVSTVIVYCDMKRLKPVANDDERLLDTDISKRVSNVGEAKEKLDLCRTSNPVKKLSPYVMAYTENGIRPGSQASQIQICPWYMDHAFNQKFEESKGYKMKSVATKLFDRLWSPFTETQIDGLATFPVTMLHELAHTREAGSKGLIGHETTDQLGYGWKKITADTRLGHTNADSYAYFGLAIDRMRSSLDPRLVQVDGKMEAMATALSRRFLEASDWSA